MAFSKAFNRPVQASHADIRKALHTLDYKSIEMGIRIQILNILRKEHMVKITLEEAWELCPEAMVAWDRDHPDIAIGRIQTWDEVNWPRWGRLTVYRIKEGRGCLDYHPDVDRWYDWGTVQMNLHAWKQQFGVDTLDEGIGNSNVPQP